MIIKGKPLKRDLVTQVDFREVAALWWAVFSFICCTGKRTHSAFYTYLVVLCREYPSRHVRITGLLLVCFKPHLVSFYGFSTWIISQLANVVHTLNTAGNIFFWAVVKAQKYIPWIWQKFLHYCLTCKIPLLVVISRNLNGRRRIVDIIDLQ